jgi:RNA polymerase sigma factor (sigma-70 family)
MSENDFKKSFSSYINRIIKNTSINYFKKKNYLYEKEIDLISEEYVSLSNKDDDAIFLLENDVLYKNLENLFCNKEYYKAMYKLTDRQKLIIYLNVIENMSFKYISEILKINEITVRTTLTKAKKAFKESLKRGEK